MVRKIRNKGITLISLVVTIIALLILTGISISMLTGQNGILNRTIEAKERSETSQKEETTTMNDYEKIIDKYETNLPSTEYTAPYLPDIDKFEKIDGTDLKSGLVVREKTTGNEYVWIEVPKTKEIYKTAGTNLKIFNENEYKLIENDLHSYTSTYRNNTEYKDEYSEDNTEGWFKNAEQYNNAKYDMLKSIYENGGFWVGRYEAGIEKNRVVSGDVNEIPKSKINMYPYTHITRTQAQLLAEKVESGKYTSSLMYGIQWDLILAFMHNRGEVDNNVLISDSTLIGNYFNNIWKEIEEKSKYSIDNGDTFFTGPYAKKEGSVVLLTTGANKNFSVMNIYDLAGNVWEWTLENSLNQDNPCVCMGGAYGTGGNLAQANFRNGSGTTEFTHCSIGFRVSIF